MKASSQGQFSQENLALENVRKKLAKKIKLYSIAITMGTSMIVLSLIMLAYYIFTTWHSETYKSIGFLLAVFGGFITGAAARKKKLAQLELISVEHQLSRRL